MGPSKEQWARINDRVRRWAIALAHSIGEHGADNSFGVTELVGKYARLTQREGYYLGACRRDMLEARLRESHGLAVSVDYARGWFTTKPEIGGCSCGAKFYSREAMDAHADECPLPDGN